MLQKVVRSTVIDAPIERVWAVLRDFNSHDHWHDVVDQSRIEGGERSDQVGCVRSFTLKDGNRIREQLLALSDTEHRSTYCIVEATVPLQRYVATVTLKPVTDGDRTFWHWESTFATPPGRERELRDMVAHDVYEAGFENLRRHLRSRRRLRASRRRVSGAGAVPLPSRQVRLHALRRPGAARSRVGRSAGAARRRSAHPPARDRRQLHRHLSAARLDPAMLPVSSASPGVPGMEAAGTVIDVGDGVGRAAAVAIAWPTSGRCPARIAACARVPADWVVRLPPAVERRGSRGAAAQGHHRRLPAARSRPCARGHASARACGGGRRRACSCAPGRGGSAPR